MQKTKLVTLLKTFTKQEMKDFEKFISSPYFSPGRNLKPLYNVLKKFHPDFNSPNFTEEKIFKKIHPKKKFERKKSLHILKVLVSEMTGLAEKFLIYNNNSEIQKINNDFQFLKILNERGLDNIYLKQSERVKKSLGNEIDPDCSLFVRLMEWEREKCNFYLKRDRQQETSDHLLKQGEFLIFYFLVEFSKVRSHLQTNYNVFNIDFEVNMVKEVMENINFEEILKYLKSNSFSY